MERLIKTIMIGVLIGVFPFASFGQDGSSKNWGEKIAAAVRQFNKANNTRMSTLDLELLVSKGFLDALPPKPDGYTTEFKLNGYLDDPTQGKVIQLEIENMMDPTPGMQQSWANASIQVFPGGWGYEGEIATGTNLMGTNSRTLQEILENLCKVPRVDSRVGSSPVLISSTSERLEKRMIELPLGGGNRMEVPYFVPPLPRVEPGEAPVSPPRQDRLHQEILGK